MRVAYAASGAALAGECLSEPRDHPRPVALAWASVRECPPKRCLAFGHDWWVGVHANVAELALYLEPRRTPHEAVDVAVVDLPVGACDWIHRSLDPFDAARLREDDVNDEVRVNLAGLRLRPARVFRGHHGFDLKSQFVIALTDIENVGVLQCEVLHAGKLEVLAHGQRLGEGDFPAWASVQECPLS